MMVMAEWSPCPYLDPDYNAFRYISSPLSSWGGGVIEWLWWAPGVQPGSTHRNMDLIRLSAPMSGGAHLTASELGSGGGADSVATPHCSGGFLSSPRHMAALLQCRSSQHLEGTLCNLKGKEVRLNSYIYFWPACTKLLWSPCPSYISWPKKEL